MVGSTGGASSTCVESPTFSGMSRKEGIAYLFVYMQVSVAVQWTDKHCFETDQSWVFTNTSLQFHSNPYFALSGQVVGWMPRPSRPPSQPDPSPPNRLNRTIFPLASPKRGIRFSKNHSCLPPGPFKISPCTSCEKIEVGVMEKSSCLIDMTIVS